MDGWSGERQIGQKLEDIEIKHVERYEFAQKYCKKKDVLDAACGCGYGSNILSVEAKHVLGIDYSQEALKYAQKNWGAADIVFRQINLNTSDFKELGDFDVIVSLETIEHLETPIVETCKKFYEILRPEGLLIISHPENEMSPDEGDKTRDENRSGYIKKIVEYIRNGDIQSLSKGVIRIVTKKFGGMTSEKVNQKKGGFHVQFNINGETVKKDLKDIGFEIKDEWYQPGRFYYPYHLVVAEKNEKTKSNRR